MSIFKFEDGESRESVVPNAEDSATVPVTAEPLTSREQIGRALSEVRNRLEAWKPLDERSQAALYRFLGSIRQEATLIDGDADLKFVLWEHLNANKKLPLRWRKAAKKKPAAVLLMVLCFGLDKKKAATRSQWLKAINAADYVGLEPAEQVFVDWLASDAVGGIIGAGKRLPKKGRSKNPAQTTDEVIDELTPQVGSLSVSQIEVPAGTVYYKGYAVLLIREPDNTDSGATDSAPVCAVLNDAEVIQQAVMRVAEHEGFRESREVTRKRRGEKFKPAVDPLTAAPSDPWLLADTHDAGKVMESFFT